jgi:DNA-binding MarR family transcriptional regulator
MLFTYNLLKKTIGKHNRPVTIKEMMEEKKDISYMDLFLNIKALEKKGLVRKRFDKERNDFLWELTTYMKADELLEKYPELYAHTLYGNESMEIKKKK